MAAHIANLDCDLGDGSLSGAEHLLALLGQDGAKHPRLELLLDAMGTESRLDHCSR